VIDLQAIVLAAVSKDTQLLPVKFAPQLAQSAPIHGIISGSQGYFIARGAEILEEM
jgi:hypothetical protein